MYELFFDFQSRPFVASPQADCYYGAEATEATRQKLSRCIDRAEGPGILVGPPGTGKTLLLHVLAAEYADRFHVVLPATGQLSTRRALLQSILYELHLPYRGLDEGELRLALMDYLRSNGKEGMLLLIDEAHTLPLRLLEEIRLITNFVHHQQPTVRLVLAGTLALEERLANPKMNLFNQRIVARCYTQSFNRDETGVYIVSQITAVGRSAGDVFTQDAVDAVYEVTSGVPRLINQVCDYALTLSALGGHEVIKRNGVEEAWADLQQLPVPAAAEVPTQGSDDMLEFGGLDEDMTSSVPFTSPSNELSSGEKPPSAIEEAAQHLDSIQHQVDAMEAAEHDQPAPLPIAEEEQFQPAGSIGPEIELTFSGVHDPFSEEFAAEEVVVDRYSAMEISNIAAKTRVSSKEGQGIAAIMSPPIAPTASSETVVSQPTAKTPHRNLDIVEPPEDEIVTAEERRSLEVPPAASEEQTFEPTLDRVMPEPELDAETPIEEHPATVSVHGSDDRSVIVIDEQTEANEPADTTGQTRRREYRHLFAKLRRG